VPIEVVQRPTSHGEPTELGDLFRLTKNRRKAHAVLFTHQFGWEVWLLLGSQAEALRTQVCRTQDEVLTTAFDRKKTTRGATKPASRTMAAMASSQDIGFRIQ
jgi:hypothetical protein